jgi:hypothetical protein
MVVIKLVVKVSSENLRSKQLFPTPLSPMRRSLMRWSKSPRDLDGAPAMHAAAAAPSRSSLLLLLGQVARSRSRLRVRVFGSER